MSTLSRMRLLVAAGAAWLLLGVALPSMAEHNDDDPSGRVAYLSDMQGELSYSPAGEDDWVDVVRNRPLIRGDRLWAERNARAELQLGGAVLRLGAQTAIAILELSDRDAQVQLNQGTLYVKVGTLHQGQSYEVATPMLAFVINRRGRYRIDVDADDGATSIRVWDGSGEAFGDNARYPLATGDAVRFYDAEFEDYETEAMPPSDSFDRYSRRRDARLEQALARRYINDDLPGYDALDDFGRWQNVSGHGSVWFPTRVADDWAPYRDGQWIWQEPWGWTWIDSAPWGFAPSHYGRWVHVSRRWGWIPGPRRERPVYAPATVAFIGGRGWSVSIALGGGGPVGWFPLGPREAYVPSYRASRNYFERVNVHNTVINNTTITNVYNNYSSGTINVGPVTYANRAVAGAITAVPRAVFVGGGPVRAAAIRLDRRAMNSGDVTRLAPLAPTARSVVGAGVATRATPGRGAFQRRVIARRTPAPVQRPFASRNAQLQQAPGHAPVVPAARVERERANAAPANVRVIPEQRAAVNARTAIQPRNRRDHTNPGAADARRPPATAAPRADAAAPRTDTATPRAEAATPRSDAAKPRADTPVPAADATTPSTTAEVPVKGPRSEPELTPEQIERRRLRREQRERDRAEREQTEQRPQANNP